MIAPLIAGFSAGVVHVLSGPDHLAAVAPLAADPRERSWLSGFLWGLGHAAGVLLVGVAALLLRELLPLEAISGWSERLVGVVLVAIGLWGIRCAALHRVHAHPHVHDGRRHAHLHVHPTAADHEAPHAHARPAAHVHVYMGAALGVGVLHGLAGSAHFLGILPALAFPSRGDAIGYVVLFAAGTVAAMTAFAAAIGWVARRFDTAGTALYRALLYTFGGAAVVVGLVWLLA